MNACKVKNVAVVIKQMNDHRRSTLRKLTVGLKRAGLYLERQSQIIVPVLTGNLRASAFTHAENENTDHVVVHVGYLAYYALYVHEDLNAEHKPGKEAKFLEQPAREDAPDMARIVQEALV